MPAALDIVHRLNPFQSQPDEFAQAPPVRKPPKPAPEHAAHQHSHAEACPMCQQSLKQPSVSAISLLARGFRHLLMSVFVIVWAALRCASFIVAVALCIVGLVGRGCKTLGMWVAHKDDREFLDRFWPNAK